MPRGRRSATGPGTRPSQRLASSSSGSSRPCLSGTRGRADEAPDGTVSGKDVDADADVRDETVRSETVRNTTARGSDPTIAT